MSSSDATSTPTVYYLPNDDANGTTSYLDGYVEWRLQWPTPSPRIFADGTRRDCKKYLAPLAGSSIKWRELAGAMGVSAGEIVSWNPSLSQGDEPVDSPDSEDFATQDSCTLDALTPYCARLSEIPTTTRIPPPVISPSPLAAGQIELCLDWVERYYEGLTCDDLLAEENISF